MNYLTREEYDKITSELKTPAANSHWKDPSSRWGYFLESIDLVKSLNLSDPSGVLEIGTMGVSIVRGCDTIDYMDRWNYKGKNPTYIHDIRNIPWPVKKTYDLCIALRVWQHLGKKQRECFLEARRISKNLLIVVPDVYKNSFGVTLPQITEWNGGAPPDLFKKVGNSTCLYFFK